MVIAREDRRLKLRERIAVKLHMFICKTCPQFENQVLTLRAAMAKWRNNTGEMARPGDKTNDLRQRE